MPSGIYQIRNLINDAIYIGSSVNIEKRKREHLCALKHEKHGNQYLQRAFNKYGKGNFVWEVLQIVTNSSSLAEREQYWLDLAQENGMTLYNLEKTATRLSFMRPRTYWLGKKRSNIDIKKFVDSHLGKVGILRNDNRTGFVGVKWLSQRKRYRAQITLNHKTIDLGCYSAILPAVIVRTLAEELFTGVNRD